MITRIDAYYTLEYCRNDGTQQLTDQTERTVNETHSPTPRLITRSTAGTPYADAIFGEKPEQHEHLLQWTESML